MRTLRPWFLLMLVLGGCAHPLPFGSSTLIATTGKHFAIRLGERIYDAFTGPEGMLLEDYLQRLHSPAGRPLMEIVEMLP
ncbi:hypothetical protein [Archangium sp.]|uniref:hypothetical protein n=1 Tax=Archangium sp. TaxID=1872627 RepID=UPI002D6FFBF3|nr:hypothetical protein [Archangium sp.]HYO59318.1 hypothetical protein [Archangium sp.]